MMNSQTGYKRKLEDDVEQQEEDIEQEEPTLASNAVRISNNMYSSVNDGQEFKKFKNKNDLIYYRNNNRAINKLKKNLARIDKGKLSPSDRIKNLALIEVNQLALDSVFMTYCLRNPEYYSKIYHAGLADLHENKTAAKQLVEEQIHAILLLASWLFAVGHENGDYQQKIQKIFGSAKTDPYFNKIRLDIEKKGLTLIEKEGSTIEWKNETKSISEIYNGYCQKAEEKFKNMASANAGAQGDDIHVNEPNYNNNGPQDKTQKLMEGLIKENSDLRQEFLKLKSKIEVLEEKVNDLEKNQVNQPQVNHPQGTLPSVALLLNSAQGLGLKVNTNSLSISNAENNNNNNNNNNNPVSLPSNFMK